MTLDFHEPTHTYKLDGKIVPSVTSVLSSARLCELPYFKDARVVRKAMVGKDVHAYCAKIDLLGGIDWDELDPEVLGYVQAYDSFMKLSKASWSRVEARVVIKVGGLFAAGTLDRAGIIFRRPWLIDLKTPAGARPHWGVQLAGYALGMDPPVVPPYRWRRAALMLRQNGTYRLKEYSDEMDFDVFREALRDPESATVRNWKRKHGLQLEEEDAA